jgi:hypothetical protein
MPIKWGSALYSKLKKRYWALPHAKGRPLIFAVQDFHGPQAMAMTGGTLIPYLYGLGFAALYDSAGNLVVSQERKTEHTWEGKTIPSGFFNQPNAENISAVISNPLGTIAKFNRIGMGAGFGSDAIHMFVTGTCYDHDPNASVPTSFQKRVVAGDWLEPWCGGMNIFHNPNAKYPIGLDVFDGIAQHYLKDGQIVAQMPNFHPYGALNVTVVPDRLS